jgi:Na+/H+ antiporter NhaD/arsenite permease-like protein
METTLMNVPAIVAAATFILVTIAILTEKMHLTSAAFLGALVLVFAHVMTLSQAMEYINQSHATLALFLGVMILVRAFEPTNIFAYLATQMVVLAKGEGKRLVLGVIAITTPICAVLPNATTVMLLAPLLPPIAQEIGVDFVPLLILMVFVANSSGLLTLVGDPATFIVGDAINITFNEYLMRLSLGGAVAVASILIMAPWLFRDIWNTKLGDMDALPHPEINHPKVLALGGILIAGVLTFFVIGETLPTPIPPAAVALLGASLALVLANQSKIDTVHNILRDVDWSTLLFFMSTFVIIGGLDKTGVLDSISGVLAVILGKNIALGSIALLVSVGLLSSIVPNIPLVVAMVPLLKQYVVNVGLAGAEILSPDFTGQLPPAVLPLFYAMMYGATLGGNGTLMGASSNIVAAGVAELHGSNISFSRFLKYGIPVMVVQLITASLYVTFAFLL